MSRYAVLVWFVLVGWPLLLGISQGDRIGKPIYSSDRGDVPRYLPLYIYVICVLGVLVLWLWVVCGWVVDGFVVGFFVFIYFWFGGGCLVFGWGVFGRGCPWDPSKH